MVLVDFNVVHYTMYRRYLCTKLLVVVRICTGSVSDKVKRCLDVSGLK